MARPNHGPYLPDKPNERGIWEIHWTVDGRSKRRSTGTSNLGKARAILAEFVTLKERQDKIDATLYVSTLLADYEAEHVDTDVISKETQKIALGYIGAHFGKMRVIDILPSHVSDPIGNTGYIDKRRAGKLGWSEGGKRRGFRVGGDGTIRRELGAFVAAIGHAVYHKRLKKQDAPSIPLPPEPEAKDRWLTRGEADRLLEAAKPTERAFVFVELALHTAQRKHAIETLTWIQIDWEARKINFNPKGRQQTKKRRTILPISDRLFEVLWLAYELFGHTAYVLGSAASARKTMETAARHAGLDDVTAHVLRHTWATWAAQRGVSLWKIAGVLGDTIETVTKRYLHHCPEHLRDAVNYLPEPEEVAPAADDMASAA